MLSARPNPTRRPEQTPPVVAVLPHPDDRELLQFGLALSHGDRTRLRAWTFHDPGRRLHPALRIARFGMATRSEADRAIRHLVDSAVRGAHVPVRPFSWDDEARAAELAGRTVGERARALAEIAAPDDRDALRAAAAEIDRRGVLPSG